MLRIKVGQQTISIRNQWLKLGVSAVLFLLSVIFIRHPENQPVLIQPQQLVQVARVVDGDTIELTDGRKVRYIGINTPETVAKLQPVQCFGKQASDENKRLVEGKQVELEKDVSETDRYGRLLRYIYVVSDTNQPLMVNKYLVEQGFAAASAYPPDIKYQDEFRRLEKEARDNKRGMWADGACPIP